MAQEFHPNVDRFHLLTERFIMHGKNLCFDRADYEMNRNLTYMILLNHYIPSIPHSKTL